MKRKFSTDNSNSRTVLINNVGRSSLFLSFGGILTCRMDPILQITKVITCLRKERLLTELADAS